MEEHYLKLAAAALALNITPRTLQNWQHRRLIPYYKVGRSVRFKLSDVKAHLESRCHVEATR
jgi:excisionase family DNA binding protein